MESFIIRIYRKEQGRKGLLAGTVERAGTQGIRTFTSFDDLRRLLSNRLEPKTRKTGKGISLKEGRS